MAEAHSSALPRLLSLALPVSLSLRRHRRAFLLHSRFASSAMNNLNLHPATRTQSAPPDLAQEIARLSDLLNERRAELSALQEEFRAFKARYAQVVGSRLAELAEVEQEIREAEARLLGVAVEEEYEEEISADEDAPAAVSVTGRTGLRKLFWSVAKVFHPDHAADEREAQRRHTIMAEASRAYREGDAESLHTLLGDEQLQAYCASARQAEEEDDLASRLLKLKDDLRTVEFGLKRIKQDRLYHLMLSVDEEAREGRDALAQMSERIGRQITKARRRLAHLA